MKAWLIRYREQLLYLLFGGLTTLVSLGSFWLVNRVLAANEHVANIVSWLLAVLFAFLTNRRFVFEAQNDSFIRQLFSFYGGRLLTLGIEELLLLIFITWLQFDSMVVKIVAQVVIIIANYFISKWFVFRKKA